MWITLWGLSPAVEPGGTMRQRYALSNEEAFFSKEGLLREGPQ